MFSSGLSYGIVSGNAVVSEGVLDFRSNYSFTLGDVRTITVNLTGTLRVTVTANITFENMPRYVQVGLFMHGFADEFFSDARVRIADGRGCAFRDGNSWR